VVLRVTTIGVLRSTTSTTRGTSISPLAIGATALRTTQTMFAPLGLFNHLTI
jgi:hypothetical protein